MLQVQSNLLLTIALILELKPRHDLLSITDYFTFEKSALFPFGDIKAKPYNYVLNNDDC